MKKIAFFLAMIISFRCGYSWVFAAQTKIYLKEAGVLDDGTVTVTGFITNPSAYQRYTAAVLKYNETEGYEYTVSDAIYIGTKETEDVSLNESEKKFTFSFKANFDEGEKYIIRIGGSNAEAQEGEFGKVYPNPDFSEIDTQGFILGDADGNKTIEAADAALLMAYVLDKEGTIVKIEDAETFFGRCNVTGGKDLTAVQAALILEKARNKNFRFPIEK